MMLYYQTKFGCKRTSSLEDTTYFDYISFHCDLDIEHSEPFFFCMTLWLMVLHNNTRFGDKMFCGSEDIVWENIHKHFEPSQWPLTQ